MENTLNNEVESSLDDLQRQIDTLREVSSRSQNYNNVSVGQTLPVRLRAGTAVPPVSNVRVAKSGAILGQTKLVVTWTEPLDIRNISRYIIYVTGLVTGQVQEIQVCSAHTSPAVFNILPDLISTVVVFVQTVLKNGQSLDIPNCPSASIITNSSATVGVGTTSPLSSVHVVTPNSSGTNLISFIDQHSTNDAGADQFLFFKTRGTPAAITAVQGGDALGSVTFGGYDGTTLPSPATEVGGARIVGRTTEAWTTSAHGARIEIRTTPNGTTGATTRIVVNQDGKIAIGSTTIGASILNVTGLPTSSAGLSAGDIWVDTGAANVLKIV